MCSRKSLRVAVKIINRNVPVRQRRVKFQQVDTELKTMKSIVDPSSHCMSLINVYDLGKWVIFVMPLFQTDAFVEANALAQSDPANRLKLAQQVSKQTLQCLRYLHSISIVHNDVKPESIFLRKVNDIDDQSQQQKYYAVLGDYSHSVILDQQQTKIWKLGTVLYQAPEVSLFRRGSTANDMWSLGLTLFTIWNPPGFSQLHNIIAETINSLKVSRSDPLSDSKLDDDDDDNMDKVLLRRFDDISGRFKDFLGRDFVDRAFLYQNVDIKLLKYFYDFISRCLTADPDLRLTVTEALEHPFVAMIST
ncbi:hypothetical protein MIR68_001530 [Amoeboaphelidium protococcarum]|nr:hypothetical protein MIR68_001530 [Amoeboaphelidium protococcarum]